MFLCNPQESSVTVCLMKIFKNVVTKKVIVCFSNLSEENFLKVVAFLIFPTLMFLFKIHQRVKGHFLNELRVSFKLKQNLLLKLRSLR